MLRLYGTRFAGRLSQALGQVADMRVPSVVLRPVIKAYSFALNIDLEEVIEPKSGFESFGDFFVRRLRPDVRPICGDQDAVLCPADGEIVDYGSITGGQSTTLTIKNNNYDLDQFLGGVACGEAFAGGGFLVVYLHPRDYHRVHSPVDGELKKVCHVPGTLYPVAPWSERRVRGIYGKNERMLFTLESAAGGTFVVAMVAAFGVGNIETRFAPGGQSGNGQVRMRCFEPRYNLYRGDELGAFRLGSTMVLIWTAGAVDLVPGIEHGRVEMGSRIGRLGPLKSGSVPVESG